MPAIMFCNEIKLSKK